jgi:hypothetical protein
MNKFAGYEVNRPDQMPVDNALVKSEVLTESECTSANFLTFTKSNNCCNFIRSELGSGNGFTSNTGYGKIVSDRGEKNDFKIGDLTSIFSPISGHFTADIFRIRLLGNNLYYWCSL